MQKYLYICRRTAEKVIQAGAETLLLARNPEKLADLVDSAEPTLRERGAIVKPISSEDPQGLIEVTHMIVT